jgi:Aspartyl protease
MSQSNFARCVIMLSGALLGSGGAIAGQPTTVPLALVRNYPILSADVDGHTVRVMFDLGGDASLTLTRAALSELGIKPTGPGHRFMDVKGNILESRTFEVPRLRIGSAVFTHVTGSVDVRAPSYPATQVGQLGYIGPSLFAGYRIVLNYQGGKMTLIPPGTQHIERAGCIGTAVPSPPDGVAKAQTDFGDLALVWDTGGAVSVVRSARIDQTRTKVVNHAVLTQHFRLNGVEFGPLEFRLIEFSEPPGVDGFIAGNFFDKHVVCLDFPGKRLLIRQ